MKKLSKEIINDVSFTLGISPSYIEKDWYLVKVLEIINTLNNDKVKAVFAGGTCLSKAYDYTKRFSEDIDFCILGLDNTSRNTRSKYKNDLIDVINSTDYLKVDNNTIKSRDENRFSSFYIEYPKLFDVDNSLRNNLKIELSFKNIYLQAEKKEIKPFITDNDMSKISIDCVSYIETAANKFNALLWRTDIKDRTKPINSITNDPALVRHLYDLNILYKHIINNKLFARLVKEIYKVDCLRGNKERNISFENFCKNTLNLLENDKQYRKEYEIFVLQMVYLEQNDISFDFSLNTFKKLVNYVIEN